MPNFGFLALVPNGTPTNRQALQGFGADSNKDTPRSLGQTACDTDGVAMMGRAVHGSNVGEANTTAADALAAYPKRARLFLQNLSTDVELEYDFGADAVPGEAFVLPPRWILQLDGDACPPDRLSVVTADGSANFKAKDW